MPNRGTYEEKHHLRAAAHLRRLHHKGGEEHSRAIFKRLIEMPDYGAARTLLCYVSFRSEVSTREFLGRLLGDGKRVVVPYCFKGRLELFRFTGLSDLRPGTLGILEPKVELRASDDRRATVDEIDLFVVPGLAFDRHGGRLGHGKGYFDGLLRHARADALLAGVAYECQLFDAVPMLPHDVRVDGVITEDDFYRRSLPRHVMPCD